MKRDRILMQGMLAGWFFAGAVGAGLPTVSRAQTALDRASQAALEYLGGGQVTDTEVGDEEGAYEIEVTLADGTEVDVHLDSDFNVISTETDGRAGSEDEDEAGDDDDTGPDED